MKNMKKLLAVLMAVAMLFALSVTAFAATSDPNMTNDWQQWTVHVAPGSSIDLYACPANAYYSPTGFSAGVTASDVSWTSGNTSIATVGTCTFVTLADSTSSLDGLYVSKATISVPSAATVGSTTITCRNNTTGASVNFSILVDSATTEDVEDISVIIYDFIYETSFEDVCHYYQNFTTPLDAMYAVKNETGSPIDFRYNALYENIEMISMNQDEIEEFYEIEGSNYIYYGWSFRVYRQCGNDSYLFADSETMAVDAFQLQDNDTIVWIFGTYDMVEPLFCNSLSDLRYSMYNPE
jgi:hypothetical protein